MELEGTIGQIHVTVSDVDRAVAFYHDALGLPLLFRVPEQQMAFLDCGGIRLYLAAPESPDPAFRSQPLLYFRTTDIEGTHERLADKGVAFLQAPHVVHRDDTMELWLAFFRDPDGCTLALMEERAV